jgi:Raf kinase inhibitor-like YbhB/YbcL family protein
MRTKAVRWIAAVVFLAAGAVPVLAQGGPPGGGPPGGRRGGMMMGPPMRLSSSAFQDMSTIPDKYTCAVGMTSAVSPAISWDNPPKGTESFVLLLHDPDAHIPKAPTDITHWLIFNIPGDSTSLPEGVKSDAPATVGVQAKNTMNSAAYMGPCAPAGPIHHYTFELFALDTKLDLQAGASREDVMKAMEGHVLNTTVYIGTFARKPGQGMPMGGPPR